MARINKSRVNFKGFSNLLKDLDRKVSIKVGILKPKGSEQVSKDLDMAGLAAVHEFGATINHLGGTPYFIKEDGSIQFVSNKKGGNLPKTKPHQIVIPARSFLRDTLLTTEGKKELQKEVWEYLTGDNDLDRVLAKDKSYLLTVAEAIGVAGATRVSNAFQTSGFGEWEPNASSTIKRKKSAMPLINNGHLEAAISYEVKEL